MDRAGSFSDFHPLSTTFNDGETMLQLLRLLSTSTEPLNYTEIRRAIAPLPVDLERARAEKLVWAGDYLP